MEKLSLVLWQERELLETLRYRLEVEQLVMAHGQSHWLANAARDVESVLEEIRGTEILRAVAADEAAAELGLPAGSSLSSLIDRVAEPWQTILADHRSAFRAASEEIARLADANRSLITAGARAAREALLGLGGALQTYTPDGTTVVGATRSARVDRSL